MAMDDYSYNFDWSGDNPLWGAINRGIDVLGAYSSRSPYYSPDDPRYQQQQGRGGGYYPQPGGQVYASPQGGAGINLSTNTLMLIAGGILIFMVASRRR